MSKLSLSRFQFVSPYSWSFIVDNVDKQTEEVVEFIMLNNPAEKNPEKFARKMVKFSLF